ncbi:hypothetical protein OAX78_03915, partial [Planctomycetota bacterium]|nr:hypothetical protein [Planctomycetota bacterium]
MTDHFAGEFNDVLDALSQTALPLPAGLEGRIAGALATAPAPATTLEDAIRRDADEAWSLALAFLGDPEAAWQTVVGGFVTLGRSAPTPLAPADTLRA